MSGGPVTMTLAREALVVFEDRDDARALRWLRPGFRHCLCLTGHDRRWTLFDPLKGGLAVAVVDGLPATELAAHLAGGGRRILHGLVIAQGGTGWSGLRPLTCVEVVKRLVGLSAAGVLTPHQLYTRLLRPAPGRPPFVELHAAKPTRKPVDMFLNKEYCQLQQHEIRGEAALVTESLTHVRPVPRRDPKGL